MTTLVSEISGLPKNKVIGQAGVLDSSSFAYFISEKLNVNMNEVEALHLVAMERQWFQYHHNVKFQENL
jgi:malate dehydrogenase